MRPRGLSSSSPSSRNVGHVAVQSPQCTQVRSTWLAAAVPGSRNCSVVKFVCIVLNPGRRQFSQQKDGQPKPQQTKHEEYPGKEYSPEEDDDEHQDDRPQHHAELQVHQPSVVVEAKVLDCEQQKA